MVMLTLPIQMLAAASSFPRGPGFYFNLFNLAVFVCVFLIWVRVCWWVDRDAHQLEMGPATWNLAVCGCGAFGLLLVWWLPFFWAAFLFLLGLAFAPAFVYANLRNQKVPYEQRVLTRRHIHKVLARTFHLRGPRDVVEDNRRGIPIRFVGKSSASEKDNAHRIARAESSKGYQVALQMVYKAIITRVTDIHMEPTKDEMTVRYRIDGMLQPAEPMSRSTGDAIISIFKVLADMNITEKRKPQDGGFSAEVEDRTVDFRVATSGSVVGEKLVLRILDNDGKVISLRQLGMRDRLRDIVRGVAVQPYGMFVVCGPTGAGKSTTLYACMNEIDRLTKNVITLENPVEYHIANVTQIEVNPKAGKTFATELRSILRQDPDVIYVGEIRDQETAEIACQAAQTGHMVFTTLHANDTVTAVARLLDLKVPPFLVSSALSAVLGQRLVRVLCPKCKVAYKPDPALLSQVGIPADKVKQFYRPHEPEDDDDDAEECEYCSGTGYHGRTGVFELLVVTDRVKDLIRENVNLQAIKQEGVKGGMRFLYEDAFRQVIEGITSIQEVLRVCK